VAFQALHCGEDGAVRFGLDEREIEQQLTSREGLVWVHITETDAADARLLREVFGFHPLAIQECLSSAYQRSKAEDFGEYLFLMFHGIDHAATEDIVMTTELDLFVGPGYVVTASPVPLAAVEQLWATAGDDARLSRGGSAILAHAIVDALIESISSTIDRMVEVADSIDEQAPTQPHRDLLPAILRLKRSALRVHRVMSPQRDVLLRLSTGEYPLIDGQHSLLFRGLYHRMQAIEDLANGLRERGDFALTTYLSAVNIRQNETMRVLSVVAAIFLPLSLVAGIYGMNFEHMPELGWRPAYFVVLAGMLAFALSMSWWLWVRFWLHTGGRRVLRELHFRVEQPPLREALAEAARLRNAVPIGPRNRRRS
jgi:magnesium transporter